MKNIVLIGFMGTGKTSTGRLLARRLGRPFIDVDERLELMAGQSIRQIFANQGEDFFRRLEQDVVAQVSRYTNTVIATGGGVVERSANVKRLRRNGVLIALTATVDDILVRTAGRNSRPLLQRDDPRAAVENLLARRAPLYAHAEFSVDTSGRTPQQVCDHVIQLLRTGGYLSGHG